MAKTSNLYARIEPEAKEQTETETTLSALDISAFNAIDMFYERIILQREIPSEIKLPANRVADTSRPAKEQYDAELEKRLADIAAGRQTGRRGI